ncbi:DUF2169 family type VI secretion system accessory protein [Neoroseomonas lacus]|uniref:DUF2169 domain-containing protein n=1 Tax=Neoroseomonas lacus TaxID=287609 RepID=A0A917KRX6_9PROT|nr:DUF2169 domain-containing protein [Neoroseomonas lacus]GGJ21632.1 hypothetical protein GCM10011320_31170 [Neoroseomonas lacus]
MKTFKPLALATMSRPIEFQRRFFLGVSAISFCPIGHRPALLGEVAMWKFLADALPPGTALDTALPKTAAEFLVTGSAFVPGGVPARTVTATVTLGSVTKQLAAVGDRWIQDGVATQPLPFVEMPLGWDRAYGGPKFAQNPLGRGIEEMPIQGVGMRVRLPNVVLPQGVAKPDTLAPVNFGPIDIAWPQRSSLAGTHGQRWLEQEFPGFASDIDWRILMTAQPDQRFAGFLKGDEDYALTNLHPEEPALTGRLPGIQPRILIQRRGAERLEEVPLSLTTVWFFPARKRLVMIHHGRVRVQEEDARDVARLVLGADMLGAPRPAAAFQEVVTARMHPEYGTLEALRDSALVPADLIVPDPDMEAERQMNEEQGLLRKRGRARELREYERERQRLTALGFDPAIHGPPPPRAEEPLPSLEQLPAVIERIRAEAERMKEQGEAFMAAREAEAGEAARAAGMTPPDPRKKLSGPPPFSAERKRAELEAAAADIEARGDDATMLRGLLADPATMQMWREAEEGERKGYLLSADGQAPAPPLDAVANAALRARLMNGKRDGRRLNLCGADLSGLDLTRFDLTEAWLDGANLSGANLSNAMLKRAVLAHARLEGARFSGADLEDANLGRAMLRQADLSDTVLRDAVLRGADLRQTRLQRADLTNALVSEAMFEGADLSGALAANIVLHEASLAGVIAHGTRFDAAVMVKTNLQGADLSGAFLAKASLIGVRGAGTLFVGAELRATMFVDSCDLRGARFAGAKGKGANFRGSNLEGAVFDGAMMDGADFSDCNLQGASFDLARAREARFITADLRHARLTRADLMGASLARADIRGTDLSDTSLYEADLARIHGDTETRLDRVQRARVRLNPRRSPPP